MNRELKQIAQYISDNLDIEFDVALADLKTGIRRKSLLVLDNLGVVPDKYEFQLHPEGAVLKWWRYLKLNHYDKN